MFEECLRHYKKLQLLLEEDAVEISHGIRGEVLDAYRATLKKEEDLLVEMVRMLYQISK